MIPYEHWSNYALYIALGTMVICFVLSGIGMVAGTLIKKGDDDV